MCARVSRADSHGCDMASLVVTGGEAEGRRFPLVEESALPVTTGVERIPAGEELALRHLPRILPEVTIPRALSGRKVLQLCGLRIGGELRLEGAVHQLLRLFLPPDLRLSARDQSLLLPEAVQLQRSAVPDVLTVMDATTCAGAPGAEGEPSSIQNMILASRDPVALDAVAAMMMRIPPAEIGWLRRCGAQGLGPIHPDAIEILGHALDPRALPVESAALPAGEVEEAVAGDSLLGSPWRWPGWLDPRLRSPGRSRRLMRSWKKTPWGKLFHAYQTGERP